MPTANDVLARACANPNSSAVAGEILDGIETVLDDLHALLYPEQHAGYDADHPFWQQDQEPAAVYDQALGAVIDVPACYQWSPGTAMHVANRVEALRDAARAARSRAGVS